MFSRIGISRIFYRVIGQIIHISFLAYTILIAVRIIGSWFPDFAFHPYMIFIAQFTDPYLNLFRRLIPPIGGVLDLTPILAFIVLQITESILRGIFK
jgi:YggT family protein